MNDADWLRKHLRGKVTRARAKLPQGPGAPEAQESPTRQRIRARLHRTLDRLGRKASQGKSPDDERSG